MFVLMVMVYVSALLCWVVAIYHYDMERHFSLTFYIPLVIGRYLFSLGVGGALLLRKAVMTPACFFFALGADIAVALLFLVPSGAPHCQANTCLFGSWILFTLSYCNIGRAARRCWC